jgi:hypothetical protein
VKTFKEIRDHAVAPCGCEMAVGVDWMDNEAFLYQPCSPGCEYYQYVLAETQRQSKPMFPAFGTIAGEKGGQHG